MKKKLALLLAGIMALSVTACGGSSQSSTPAASGTEQAETQEAETPADDPAAVTAEDNGFIAESVTVAIPDASELAPYTVGGNGGGMVKRAIYQALGARDGFAGEFKNILMDSYTVVDSKTVDVTICENIVDSAGNAITADDVVFSYGKCAEVNELSEINDIASVEKTGDYSVRMTWKEDMSLGAFETLVANVYIVSQAAFEASSDGMSVDPVGTGPYVLKSFAADANIVAELNENYWESAEQMDAAIEKQNVKTINYQVLTESSQIAMALQTNNIDISDAVNNEDLPQFREGGAYSDKNTVYSTPKTSGYILCMNASEDSPLHDQNLRLAVEYAINTDFLIQAVNGGNNTECYVMGSTAYLDWNDALKDMHVGYDLDLAKDYMSKSEYAGGTDLTIMYMSGDAMIADLAVILQAQLAEIGITLTISEKQFGQYLADEGSSTAWDFTVNSFAADDYLTNAWKKYFDVNSTGTGYTKNFVQDDQLQSLMMTAESVDGHSEESVNALWQYISDNAWAYGLITGNYNYVFNKTKIQGIAMDNSSMLVPQGFVYVEQ